MNLRSLLFTRPDGRLSDAALCLLRVSVAGSLFAKHGWEKLTGFQFMAHTFKMDPLHIGVYPSLAFATLADGICTLLVIAGLFTRAASAVIIVNLTVVFFVMQNAFGLFPELAPVSGLPPPGREHTELAFLYLVFFIFLIITGPGRYSVDDRLIAGRMPGARP